MFSQLHVEIVLHFFCFDICYFGSQGRWNLLLWFAPIIYLIYALRTVSTNFTFQQDSRPTPAYSTPWFSKTTVSQNSV